MKLAGLILVWSFVVLVMVPPGRQPGTAEGLLLTLSEAAAVLRRPEGTLRDWRLKGIGPKSARIGGRVYYRREELLRYIDSQFDGD